MSKQLCEDEHAARDGRRCNGCGRLLRLVPLGGSCPGGVDMIDRLADDLRNACDGFDVYDVSSDGQRIEAPVVAGDARGVLTVLPAPGRRPGLVALTLDVGSTSWRGVRDADAEKVIGWLAQADAGLLVLDDEREDRAGGEPDPRCSRCGNGTFGADVCGVCKRENEARRAMLAEVVVEYEPQHVATWRAGEVVPRFVSVSSRNCGRSHAIEHHATEEDALAALAQGAGDWYPVGVVDLDSGAMAEAEPTVRLGEWIGTFEPEPA